MHKIRNWQIAGTIFTCIVGTLVHFIYEWFGGTAAAVFGAVNESTWEHLKLLFWPVVVFGIIEYFAYGRKTKGFLPAKAVSILIGMITIIGLFYTYSGILGYNTLVLDILTFAVGVFAAYYYSYRHLNALQDRYLSKAAAICAAAGLVILIVLFIVFTYYAPHIGLFLDPVSGTYGI